MKSSLAELGAIGQGRRHGDVADPLAGRQERLPIGVGDDGVGWNSDGLWYRRPSNRMRLYGSSEMIQIG